MAVVTYKNQPAIHKTRGAVPLEGTSHVYRVTSILWPDQVEKWIENKIIGTSLHLCCGKSQLGDVRCDLYADDIDVRLDAARLPFPSKSFDTVIIDPPYSGKFQWNHDMLNELHRVASNRIIFQHWFCPVDKYGRFKKAHVFSLTDAAVAPYLSDDNVFLAVKDNKNYFVVKEDTSPDDFFLMDLAFWTPRTYFGRVQLISVLDAEYLWKTGVINND